MTPARRPGPGVERLDDFVAADAVKQDDAIARNDGADSLTLHVELDMVHQEVTSPTDNGNPAVGSDAGLGGFLEGLLNGLRGESDATPPADRKGPLQDTLPPPERKQ